MGRYRSNVSGQAWAILGVVVGAILGGGAQITADVFRSRRDRRRWVDDHRRVAYLAVLEATERLTGSLMSDVLSGLNVDADRDKAKSGPANADFHRAKHTAEFYGSQRVIQLLDEVDVVLMVDAYVAAFDDDRRAIVRVLKHDVRPKVDSLSEAMRAELGLIS